MSDLRPIGSEKLPVEDKIKRIMEIARYGETSKNEDYHIKTTSFQKKAADGLTYAVVKEKDGYYVKSGINESELDYVDGISNKTKNRFRSYSSALKRVNLMLKPINETYNKGQADPIFEQEEGGEEKFVIKVDTPADEVDMEDDMDMGDEEMGMEDDMDMGDEEMDMEDDMGDEEVDMETEVEIDTEIPSMKSIQKLTGKLGQKLRDAEEELDSESIKYVLNSVISAVNLESLDDEDLEDILDRFETEEDVDYDMEDEVDVVDDEFGGEEDMGMEDDMDMGDEEMDVEMSDEEEPVMENLGEKVNKTLKKYFKETKKEKVLKESKTKKYIRGKIQESTKIKEILKVSKSVEQELGAKKIVKEDVNAKFLGLTKKGTIVFESNNSRIGITPRGKVIR